MNSANQRKHTHTTRAYRADSSHSKALYAEAMNVMPGGNTRHSVALQPWPIYVERAAGCRVIDVDGDERIDFVNNYTSIILGHSDPVVIEAVNRQLHKATAITMPSEYDIKLAALLVERVPYLDQVRFCNSGSEAVMMAIKAARTFTGRAKIAKFEGAYHGIYDYAQVSDHPTENNWGELEAPASIPEPGTAPSIAQDVVILPWNRPEACLRLLEKHASELAAIVVDPLPGALGMIPPRPGFLEMLREITALLGILYIADEVMSFRLDYHGAHHAFGIEPDLTSLGKIIGGGFPVGAVGGKRDVMAVFDHTKNLKLHHSGTFNANPITMVAGYETMQQMTPAAFHRLNEMGEHLRSAIRERLAARDVNVQVFGRGSMFSVAFTDAELTDFRDITAYRKTVTFSDQLCHGLLSRGILTSPRGALGNLSVPMTEAELEVYLTALEETLVEIGLCR